MNARDSLRDLLDTRLVPMRRALDEIEALTPDVVASRIEDGDAALASRLVLMLRTSETPAAVAEFWGSPIGQACSIAIGTHPDRIEVAQPPMSISEAAAVLGTAQGTVAALKARGRLARLDPESKNSPLDPLSVHDYHLTPRRAIRSAQIRLREAREAREAKPD